MPKLDTPTAEDIDLHRYAGRLEVALVEAGKREHEWKQRYRARESELMARIRELEQAAEARA